MILQVHGITNRCSIYSNETFTTEYPLLLIIVGYTKYLFIEEQPSNPKMAKTFQIFHFKRTFSLQTLPTVLITLPVARG